MQQGCAEQSGFLLPVVVVYIAGQTLLFGNQERGRIDMSCIKRLNLLRVPVV